MATFDENRARQILEAYEAFYQDIGVTEDPNSTGVEMFPPVGQDFTMYGPGKFQRSLASYKDSEIKFNPDTDSYYCAFSAT